MPSLQIPPGYGLAKLRWQLLDDPEEMISTIGFQVGDDFSGPFEQAQGIYNKWLTSFTAGMYSSAYTFVGVSVSIGQDGDPLVSEFTQPIVGSANWEVVPQNCAILVRKVTALGGKRGTGRMFLPPAFAPDNAVSHHGFLSNAQQAAIQEGLDNFRDQMAVGPSEEGTGNQPPVLLHNSEAGAEPVPPTTILRLACQPQVATQRQRLRR